MPAKDIGELKRGPMGDRVMYENPLVRVWDFVVEPGKSKGWHRHELPYVIIPMTDGDIELESALTGEIERPKGKIGEPIWRDAGEVHDLRNVGNATYRNILVEIKAAMIYPRATAEPPAAAPHSVLKIGCLRL